MIPRVLPTQQCGAVLLSTIHELVIAKGQRGSFSSGLRGNAYEKPHAGTQGSGCEAVKRANGGDVDRVVGISCHD